MGGVLFYAVLFLVCGLSWSEQGIYKVGIVNNANHTSLELRYKSLAKEAGRLKLDMFLLPPTTQDWSDAGDDDYGKRIAEISELAKSIKLYIVVQLEERVKCEHNYEFYENSVVFDRDGNIVSVHKHPLSSNPTCNSTQLPSNSFTTDFGVTFTPIHVKDLLVKNPEELDEDVRNYLLSGSLTSELPFLSSHQLLSSWSRVTGSNLVSSTRVYNGWSSKVAHIDSFTRIVVVEMQKEGGLQLNSDIVDFSQDSKTFVNEDLSQYSIRPVDLGASRTGLRETVCDGAFCCDFFLKTAYDGSNPLEPYSLVVFDGTKRLGSQDIGIQVCGVVACDGGQNNCAVELKHKIPEVTFEAIAIKGNFSANSIQYPTTFNPFKRPLSNEQYKIDSTDSSVTMSLEGSRQLMSFGIYGREFSKDSFYSENNEGSEDNNGYNYIFDSEMQDLYDYVWIRLRVMIFVVSIYVLEMI